MLPALELISTVAAPRRPARATTTPSTPRRACIDRYHRAARRAHALLLLDIQPGGLNDFPSELRRLTRWLRAPDVGLALGPRVARAPRGAPRQGDRLRGRGRGQQRPAPRWRGSSPGATCPEKLFVIHQFTEDMVRDAAKVVRRPGLATVFNVDGSGDRANKVSKYRALTASKPGFRHGFKLFYSEDTGMMRPRSVMALHHAAGSHRLRVSRRAGQPPATPPRASRSRSSIRRILPVSVFGRSSTNSIRRG